MQLQVRSNHVSDETLPATIAQVVDATMPRTGQRTAGWRRGTGFCQTTTSVYHGNAMSRQSMSRTCLSFLAFHFSEAFNHFQHIEVSWNRATPKSCIWIRFSITIHWWPPWRAGNPHMGLFNVVYWITKFLHDSSDTSHRFSKKIANCAKSHRGAPGRVAVEPWAEALRKCLDPNCRTCWQVRARQTGGAWGGSTKIRDSYP